MAEPSKLSKRTSQLLDDLIAASDVAAVSAEYDGEYQQELHMRDFSRRKARLVSRLVKLEQQAACYRKLRTRAATMSNTTDNWVFNNQTGEFEIPETEVLRGQEGKADGRTAVDTQETSSSEGRAQS